MRSHAEDLLRDRLSVRAVTGGELMTPDLLHELQVHQIELEMQNEELRRSQAALALHNARYVDLYDRAPVGYCTVSADGRIGEANLTLAALLGMDREALAHEPLTRFISRDHQDTYYHYRRHLHGSAGPVNCELMMLRADGTQVPVDLTAVAALGADGSANIRIMVADLSARRRAEESLASSELLSAAVLDSVAAQIAVIDASGQIVAVNASWRKSAAQRGGAKAVADGIGLNYLDVCRRAGNRPDCAEVEPILAGILLVLEGRSRGFELEYACTDCGVLRWYRINVTPMSGRRPGAVISHIDVTAIRRAEHERREGAERIQLISRASRDIIWDWNLVTGALWISGDLEGSSVEVRDGTFDRLARKIVAEDRDRVIAGIDAAIAGTTSAWADSFRLARADGTEVPVVARGDLVRSGSGVAIRMVAAMTDVSARLQLEERLRQSQRLEAVGQLTGGVAHDFNNLLTVILGNADLLRESVAEDASRSALAQSVIGAAQRAAELTQRLLAFARQQPLDPRAVDIN
jgi:PAS domain S-box-containing protein